MIVNKGLSIDLKILEIKINFLEMEPSALSIWAFIETSIKEILQYLLRFKKISIDAYSKHTIKFLNELVHSQNQCSLSHEMLTTLSNDFFVKISNDTNNFLKVIYFNRNEMAHTNTEHEMQLTEGIITFIDNFKKSVVKLL